MSYYPPRTYPYRLFIAKSPTGASEVFFDLFNAAGSGYTLAVSSVQPIVSGAVAVTGVLGVDLFLTFTSAIGTAGTAATRSGTSLTASTFGTLNPAAGDLPAGITARRLPTGGATAGNVITMGQVFTEETNSATYLNKDLITPGSDEVIVPEGFGIQVQQGAVASVGNIAFMVHFGLIAK
jgi:hypothetical protein